MPCNSKLKNKNKQAEKQDAADFSTENQLPHLDDKLTSYTN